MTLNNTRKVKSEESEHNKLSGATNSEQGQFPWTKQFFFLFPLKMLMSSKHFQIPSTQAAVDSQSAAGEHSPVVWVDVINESTERRKEWKDLTPEPDWVPHLCVTSVFGFVAERSTAAASCGWPIAPEQLRSCDQKVHSLFRTRQRDALCNRGLGCPEILFQSLKTTSTPQHWNCPVLPRKVSASAFCSQSSGVIQV